MSTLRITPWRIESRDAADRAYRESIFSQGNGYMGTRGYRPDQRGDHPAWRSTFLAGFFEYVKPRITDMVNQPDFSGIQFCLNGIDSQELAISEFLQYLDMKQNLLVWEYTLTDDTGRQTQVKQEKILSMADRHVAAIRLSLTPLNWCGTVKVFSGIDAGVENLPIADDQLTENIEFIRMWGAVHTRKIPAGGFLETETTVSHRKIAMAYVIAGEGAYGTAADDRSITTILDGDVVQGKTWIMEKRTAVASFRDGDASEIVSGKLTKLEGCCFDELLAESGESWAKIWDDVDVEITGNDEWQGAIRYNILQLVQAMPYGDPHASIGARGMTHGRYKGCYFWDTEIFMLPLFVHTQPAAARTLLEYRYNTLPDAVKSAKGFSTKGARYSWMSSDTGFEQCESWDTGCCEIHITADIAYAICRYWEQTGDDVFMKEHGAEILLQTARYWTDRFTYSLQDDRWHLLFVKGPDEYCGVTVDDFYTVSLAKDNLEKAAWVAAWMQENYPQAWAQLADQIGFELSEPGKWLEIASKVVRKLDGETKLWKQDATFELLEPLDIHARKHDDVPLYHKIGFDRLQRYQVLKQPAVLMYMALCPEKFSKAEVEAAWNCYEPKTLHDSTLSFGIHALIAARLGKKEEAVRYFEKALFLDLKNVMQNTAKEGIHTAALGAAWQALVLGFGGLDVRNGAVSADNRLPDFLDEMRYKVYCQGKRYQIILRKNKEPEFFGEI